MAEKKRRKKEKKPQFTASGGMDYSVYTMKPQEWLAYLLLAAAVLFAVGYIFYRDFRIAGALALLGFAFPGIQRIARRRKRLTMQFKDMLYSLSSTIGAGSSVEMAMSSVLEDMERQYPDPDTPIVRELELIVSKLGLGQNIEDLFLDFANRSGIDDIRTFANIFEISKRTGGNIIQITRRTSDIITQKIETRNDIETLLAERKMEQRVMVVMPIALTLLLTESTADFMAPLFNSFGGRVVCTAALALVLIGYFWSKKLTDIEI